MKKKYDLVIFDVDGTLLDTSEGILSAAKYTINEMGLNMLDDKTLATFIGPPIQDSFAKAYHLKGTVLQDMAAIFRERYSREDLLKAVPYPGIYDVLKRLRETGIQSAIATYKREDYAIKLLKYYNFDQFTKIICGGDHENKLKKKNIIEKCISISGISDQSKIVMVGDTSHDALGAEQAGVDFIGVTFGFGFREETDLKDVRSIGCADKAISILDYII